MVEVPGKMGFPPSSSPRMHPAPARPRSQPLTAAAGRKARSAVGALDCSRTCHRESCQQGLLQACIAFRPEEPVMQRCSTWGT